MSSRVRRSDSAMIRTKVRRNSYRLSEMWTTWEFKILSWRDAIHILDLRSARDARNFRGWQLSQGTLDVSTNCLRENNGGP